ncbi:MAG: 3-dehydroquinate synthase [Oscillospiraceae bacterium]|jgi:3-dehydroquinate synthase|nr:3-dehydroquinate synthase [Oscillospiraceae bacterium]
MSIRKIKINAGRSYNVIIGKGLLADLAEHLPYFKGGTAVIITDSNVFPLYEQKARKSLESAGYRVLTHAFESGEKHKTTDELVSILNFLADNKVTRSDFIIALGGGITGDMAGFAAGIYLRGIGYVQVPTTLLAAVDSSVGGKTAVNLNAGKNLAGLFYQPKAVICDPDTFETLDDLTFADGVSEAVKHGFITDEGFFRRLSGKTRAEYMNDIIEIIARNVEIKGGIVEADEFEQGRRQLLNFGHTAGHAIEKCTNHSVSHGQAVAAGMVLMSRAAYKKGFCYCDYSQEIKAAFSGFLGTFNIHLSAEQLYEVALSDKKRSGKTPSAGGASSAGGKINIIIPERIGKCVVKEIEAAELLDVFKAGLFV